MNGRWERGEQAYQRGHNGPRRRIVAASHDIFFVSHSSGQTFFTSLRNQQLNCGHEPYSCSGGGDSSVDVFALKRRLGRSPRCPICADICADPEKAIKAADFRSKNHEEPRFARDIIEARCSLVMERWRSEYHSDDILVESVTALIDENGALVVRRSERNPLAPPRT